MTVGTASFSPLRTALLAAARHDRLGRALQRVPLSREVIARFIVGASADDSLRAVSVLSSAGLHVSLDYLGEDVASRADALAATCAYVGLLSRLGDLGLSSYAEVSVKLSALGQRLDSQFALDQVRKVCIATMTAGTTVTLDMEDHTTTDLTLGAASQLREDFPWVGVVLQAALKRSEADCRCLAGPGSRVRLCKGAYREPSAIAYQRRSDIDRSYLRCLTILMRGDGYPMVATHDPALIAAAGQLASRSGRGPLDYEFQMLYGVRPDEQRRLAAGGRLVRIYVPYGKQWYSYFMRRLAERPGNLGFFLRAASSPQ